MLSIDYLQLGFRFLPTPEGVIQYYLIPKIENTTLQPQHEITVPEVNVYDADPWDLVESHPLYSHQQDWYFITKRNRHSHSQSSGSGYWSPTGKDEPIIQDGNQIGSIKALEFYVGQYRNGIKTNWKMNEYTIKENTQAPITDPLKVDEWVICKIYNQAKNGGHQWEIEVTEDDVVDRNSEHESQRQCFVGMRRRT